MSQVRYGPEVATWRAVWPVQMMKGKSLKEGRVLSVSECLEEVTVQRIADAAIRLGFRVCVEEEKQYPRDPLFLPPGRVRVELRKEGAPVNDKIGNKRQLLKALVVEIPKGQYKPTKQAPKASEQEKPPSQPVTGVRGARKRKGRR